MLENVNEHTERHLKGYYAKWVQKRHNMEIRQMLPSAGFIWQKMQEKRDQVDYHQSYSEVPGEFTDDKSNMSHDQSDVDAIDMFNVSSVLIKERSVMEINDPCFPNTKRMDYNIHKAAFTHVLVPCVKYILNRLGDETPAVDNFFASIQPVKKMFKLFKKEPGKTIILCPVGY
eukprot:14569690-Ditylum_brightwellii.AAC.1